MQGSKMLLAIIVLVYQKNVGQHSIIDCSGVKLISQFTVFQSLHNLEVVHWQNDQPSSSAVLNSLEALNPSAKLHYRISFYSP